MTAFSDATPDPHPDSPSNSHPDAQYMQRCIALARQAIGQTAPNPMVGSVIVKDGSIIGEGYHPKAGEPHAEVFALRAAGTEAQGATLYVNLEPCSHHGRTPPCADAIIAAGITRVVAGMVDPNPKVAGRGLDKLRSAGISVTIGIEEAACQRLNEAFIHRILHQRPFGILKYAMTLDGKIATTTGHSAWITQPESRRWVHQLRSTCDAIIIGGNTVRKDNPHLTTHGISAGSSDRVNPRQPHRIVLTQTLDLPLQAHLWDVSTVPTIVIAPPGANPEVARAIIDQGVELIEQENINPDHVMQILFDRGFSQVLWECGGTLAAAAIQAQAIQKIYAFIAPKIIGGQDAPSPIGNLGLQDMTKAIELQQVRLQSIASDFLVEGYLKP